MDADTKLDKPHAKVVVVTNLTRNVVESHLQTIFGFYGDITKVDLPMYGKSGQNRGRAALEYVNAAAAHKAASHMNGGQLDGAVLRVELSDLPVRSRSRSPRPPPRARNGRDKEEDSVVEAEANLGLEAGEGEMGSVPGLMVVEDLRHEIPIDPVRAHAHARLYGEWIGWYQGGGRLVMKGEQITHKVDFATFTLALRVVLVVLEVLSKQESFCFW
ncbi:hypothetical protein EUX98_g8017 [Antrodiella citrinella]|uniref:RRM domain-containing protein n=1 Tax=Antrodiella citrinella TaxID=2447956 RepID=A0A4S4MCZ0_9APHY|nr:hypothetical protein EUX98_g8017 [Antrodiella citrinella]